MNRDEFLNYLLAKFNTRAGSVFCAAILILGGMYMCFSGLTTTGSIDLKATFVEGHIETGSLGLISMFLGVVIILVLNFHRPYEGQEIRLLVNGNEIIGKGLSFRKMRELVQAATTSAPTTHAKNIPHSSDRA